MHMVRGDRGTHTHTHTNTPIMPENLHAEVVAEYERSQGYCLETNRERRRF